MPGVLGVKGSQRKALDANPSLAAGNPVASMADVGSSEPATTDALGTVLLGTEPDNPAAPVVAGDNDPRLTDARTPTAHGHTKGEVGLGSVDNTSDADKPVSTAQAGADGLRVLKAGDVMGGPLAFTDAGLRLRRSSANILLLEANSAEIARVDSNRFRVAATKRLESALIHGTGSIRLPATYAHFYPTTLGLVSAIGPTDTTFEVYVNDGDPEEMDYPHSFWLNRGEANEETFIAISAPAIIDPDNGIYEFSGVHRARPINTAAQSHDADSIVSATNSYDVVDGYVLPHDYKFTIQFSNSSIIDSADPLRVFLPPRGSVGSGDQAIWTPPLAGQLLAVGITNTSGKDFELREYTAGQLIATLNGEEKSALVQYNADALSYLALGVNP